jgi:hypothetical protein
MKVKREIRRLRNGWEDDIKMIKRTYVPIDDTKSCRGNGGTAPFILNCDKKWSREDFTPQTLCLQRKKFIYLLSRNLGGLHRQPETFEK